MALTHMRAARRAAIWLVAGTLTVLPMAVPTSAAAAPTEASGVLTGTAAVVTSPVTIHSGTIDLPGTVVAPTGPNPSGQRPGLVIVHDAGPRQRHTYEPEARALAAAGIVTLIYDKRTTGYSLTNRSFPALADDATAAVEVLRGWPGVDPDRVGLLGRSEGGWVAPLAAARSSAIAFVITVGASGLPPARTQAWSNLTHLDHAEVARSLHRSLGVNLTRILVAAGMFGAAGYDPAPALAEVDQPLLAIFGELDRSTAPGESVEVFRSALERGGNPSYTIRVVPAADHQLMHSPDGFTSSDDFAPGYLELVISWVNGLAEEPPPVSVDPAPPQRIHSAPLAPVAWYESVPAQLALLLLMVAAFLAYPVGAVVRRLRGRQQHQPIRRWAATVAAVGPATVAGGALYLGYLTMTGTETVGPVLAGRPVPWLILQLLAAGVVAAAIGTAATWWRHRHQVTAGAGVSLPLAGAALFLPWALYWGLLLP